MAYAQGNGLVAMMPMGASEDVREAIRQSPRILQDRISRNRTPMRSWTSSPPLPWADGWLSTTAK